MDGSDLTSESNNYNLVSSTLVPRVLRLFGHRATSHRPESLKTLSTRLRFERPLSLVILGGLKGDPRKGNVIINVHLPPQGLLGFQNAPILENKEALGQGESKLKCDRVTRKNRGLKLNTSSTQLFDPKL